MIITPKIRGFICTTAHPDGCYQHVKEQVDIAAAQPGLPGPKKVLVIGASMGYGLASRIALAFGAKAQTLGVMFERPSNGKRCASAGWYNTAAFESLAAQSSLYAQTLNGDAFSLEMKQQVVEKIKKELGQVDCVIYSLAAPRRTDAQGNSYSSVLKPLEASYTNKTVDVFTGEVTDVTIDPANQEEVDATIKVMGGEDWLDWIQYLADHDVLAPETKTFAYSYIGPDLTHPIYKEGSIGQAKNHLLATVDDINDRLSDLGGQAYVAINKAVVTQSSAAIPVVPLYIAILFQVMKEKNLHEDCIEQMVRLFQGVYGGEELVVDDLGRLRVDDWEMSEEVQQAIETVWRTITTDNVTEVADLASYRENFERLFGFSLKDVNYDADVDVQVPVPSLDAVSARD